MFSLIMAFQEWILANFYEGTKTYKEVLLEKIWKFYSKMKPIKKIPEQQQVQGKFQRFNLSEIERLSSHTTRTSLWKQARVINFKKGPIQRFRPKLYCSRRKMSDSKFCENGIFCQISVWWLIMKHFSFLEP